MSDYILIGLINGSKVKDCNVIPNISIQTKKRVKSLFGRGWVTPLVYISLNILHRMPLIAPIFKRCFGRCKQVR